jgi:hypothetical protein
MSHNMKPNTPVRTSRGPARIRTKMLLGSCLVYRGLTDGD